MRGLRAFLAKELLEIVRTWRIWVLPGIVLFLALGGPPLAMLTPRLLESFAGSQPGVVIEFPDPTYRDAYAQWVKNLTQIVVFAIVIMFGGLVNGEVRAGTAALVLTKPLARPAFVLAKFAAALALLVGTVALGAALTWGLTLAVFGQAPVGELARATALWLALGTLLLALMTLLSVLLRSQAAAAGVGLAVYFLLVILTVWEPAVRHTPAGLLAAPAQLAAGGAPPLAWPLATGALVSAAAVLAAMAAFRHQEL